MEQGRSEAGDDDDDMVHNTVLLSRMMDQLGGVAREKVPDAGFTKTQETDRQTAASSFRRLHHRMTTSMSLQTHDAGSSASISTYYLERIWIVHSKVK